VTVSHTVPGRAPGELRRLEVGGERIDRELALTRAGYSVTVVLFLATVGFLAAQVATRPSFWLGVEALVMTAGLGVLVWGSLVFFVTRGGYLRRRSQHLASRTADLEAFAQLGERPASVLVLVPSYREEQRIVRQALLSVALQEYPRLRVVLLIDDPPEPGTAEDAALLAAARELPGKVGAELEAPRLHVSARLATIDLDRLSRPKAAALLASLYEWSADWLEAKAAAEPVLDHSDRFFADAVLGERARRLRATAAQLRANEQDELAPLPLTATD
jgi:cellulose synthase/poly-beta-1,6-N-acetylglucosamine synthase-like glycosyltransferase